MCKEKDRDTCIHLSEFLTIEIDIFKRHLGRHKNFRHISDDNDALMSFIQDYGGLIKDIYCAYICKDKCNNPDIVKE